MELFREVASIIQRNKEQAIEIKPQDRLREDLLIDSFDTMMIACEIEDHFHINIDPDEFKGLRVVQDIVDNLKLKVTGYQIAKT
jgi:acyl carrier protein